MSFKTPAFHTILQFKDCLMSLLMSPSTKSKSARFPSAITPRSCRPKHLAVTDVADLKASTAVKLHFSTYIHSS